MDAVDIYDDPLWIENEVLDSYLEECETLEATDVAPELVEIYFNFYAKIMDNIMEAYESVMGVGTPLREEWLRDMGIDRHAIPDILTVSKILNMHGYGYMYNGVLYNFIQRPILIVGGVHRNGDDV